MKSVGAGRTIPDPKGPRTGRGHLCTKNQPLLCLTLTLASRIPSGHRFALHRGAACAYLSCSGACTATSPLPPTSPPAASGPGKGSTRTAVHHRRRGGNPPPGPPPPNQRDHRGKKRSLPLGKSCGAIVCTPTFGSQIPPTPQGCIRREGTSEAAPEAVKQAVGGGCQSGWGRLLSVTKAVEAGTCRQGDSGWAQAGRPGGGVGGYPPPLFQCIPPPPPPSNTSLLRPP